MTRGIAILGGTLAAGAHVTKSSTRALANTSPEPFSNIGLSLGEDLIVPGGLALALLHPLVFVALLALALALGVWLVPKIWRFLKRLVGYAPPQPTSSIKARVSGPGTGPVTAAPAPR